MTRLFALFTLWSLVCTSVVPWQEAKAQTQPKAPEARQQEHEEFFESKVRPLLVERCQKCHGITMAKGGLRLDSRAALLRGGESGPALVPGNPQGSLLLQAVRHENGLEMPPDGKLPNARVADLSRWIKAGAVWPGSPKTPVSTPVNPTHDTTTVEATMPPNNRTVVNSLQLWLKADALTLEDGASVPVWPDQSGHGRDATATKGVRASGVGQPGRFVARGAIMGRPAVYFSSDTGLATSPDLPVPIHGNPALTIVIVCNLQPHTATPPFDGIFGLGDPAHPSDPGKPLAALVQINQHEGHALHFAGGWNHDVSLGQKSFQPYFHKPTLLTIIKNPGPMLSTTSIYLRGVLVGGAGGKPLEGRDQIPDIRHRRDMGAYLGKALNWCGSIQGEVAEVIVYNTALSAGQRRGLENHLAEKYGLWLDTPENQPSPTTFTEEERNFWAYQPVRDVTPPSVRDNTWVKSPVDRFILHEMEKRRLRPAPPADKLAWLRRVTFDLTGLPPTPRECENFLRDQSPEAFTNVVDRLLASPHYGERWGRHWLDVARYAETTANDANAVMRYAWRYRNYVIDAMNRDLPYNEFLVEQLAGDLLPMTNDISMNTRRVIATGYLMVGPKALAETDKEQSRLDIVDDCIDVTGRAMLGLTLACARCHDHKFDAIRAKDYYALAGIFRSMEPFQDENRNATMWWEFPVPQGPGQNPLMVMAPKEGLPRNLRVHARGNRFTLGKAVARGVPDLLRQSMESWSIKSTDTISPHHPRSGRLELARWIASDDNPLTARVMVNRVWQYHFGQGLVSTSDNFGARGARPTHPNLLDWLARQFIISGWSLKAMHRLLLLSNTYRQSVLPIDQTRGDPEQVWYTSFKRRRLSAEESRDALLAVSGQLDVIPGTNESGEILFERAENIGAKIRPNRLTPDDAFYNSFRKRSIYLPVVRNMLPDVLALFDAADPNGVTATRNDTTVPSQALFLLNSPLVRAQARAFAERLLAADSRFVPQHTESDRFCIERAYQHAWGRTPTPMEVQETIDFLHAYMADTAAQARPLAERRLSAWQSFCQTLFCANEFLYVE